MKHRVSCCQWSYETDVEPHGSTYCQNQYAAHLRGPGHEPAGMVYVLDITGIVEPNPAEAGRVSYTSVHRSPEGAEKALREQAAECGFDVQAIEHGGGVGANGFYFSYSISCLEIED